jgi:hypothetical protein
MIQRLRNPFGCVLLVAMLLAACASPQLTSSWKDSSYKAQPARIMVISMDKNPLTRMFFEDKFVEHIKARGTDAVASYTVLSSRNQEDPKAIMAKVNELGADAVLVTRLLSKEIASNRGAAATVKPQWQDYYGYDKQSLYPLGIIAEEGYAVLETRMYEAANIKMVWSVTSKTPLGGAYQQRIESYIDTMVKAMIGQGLLRS